MSERDMTPEEREKFERQQLHHEDEESADGGPASEPEIRREQPPGRLPTPLPNPD